MMAYRVRLGTFNVNGKLPSQDLSPWVKGPSNRYPYIPPLNDVSPINIGEVTKGPPDYLNGDSNALTRGKGGSFCSNSY